MEIAEYDYTFDDHLNMYCSSCKKVVFSTKPALDDAFKSTYKPYYNSATGPGHGTVNQGYNYQNRQNTFHGA